MRDIISFAKLIAQAQSKDEAKRLLRDNPWAIPPLEQIMAEGESNGMPKMRGANLPKRI